ncbi:hypothetical protein EJB05_51851, partial [Eragrostis curvula]
MASSSSFALDFLRRLLCAHATGNSDGAAVAARRDAPGHLSAPEPEGEGRSPCIVARLMGLDAMPAAAEAPHATPQPLRRSRSASSAEGGRSPSPSGFGDAAAPAKVRASASLREKPAYLRAENDMFLLLSFSPEDRGAETVVLLAADDEAERRESGAKKQRRGRRRKLRFGDDNDDEAESSASALARRDCNAHGSSPVSVLEARDAHEESSTTTTTTSSSLEDVEPCSATSGEVQFVLEQQITREKSQTDLDQLDEVTPARSSVHASRCSDRERRHRRMVNECEVSTSHVSGIWPPVCRVVEEDIRNMEWLPRDGANVVAEMDSDILDQLIYEATAELVQLTSDLHALPLHSPLLRKCSGKPSNWRYPSPRQIQERQAVGGY